MRGVLNLVRRHRIVIETNYATLGTIKMYYLFARPVCLERTCLSSLQLIEPPPLAYLLAYLLACLIVIVIVRR
jgi:hypothetical protein